MGPHLDVILVQTAHKLVGFGPLWGVGGGSGGARGTVVGGRSESPLSCGPPNLEVGVIS